MAKPWEKYGGQTQLPRTIEGDPRQPAPQTAAQTEGDILGVDLKRRDLARAPLQDEQARTSIESGRTSIADSALDNATQIRTQFEGMKPVQEYRTVLPQYAAAIRAEDNKAGDLQIIYAFGKVMDPGSVVREGELALAQNVGGVSERIKGYLASLQGEGRLSPSVRRELLMEIRSRASAIADQYNQVRQTYKGIAERSRLNPLDIVGEHPGGPFQQAEADFVGRPITNLDGSQGAVPREQRVDPLTPSNIVDRLVGEDGSLHVNVTDDRMPGETEAEYQARIARGEADAVQRDVATQRGQGGFMETADAVVRGIADVPTFGGADEIAAAMDTIFGDGTMRQNLRKQRGIDEYDYQNNFAARLAGQIGGGLVLPMGKIGGARDLAVKGGAYGAGYGFGSGEGNVGDRSLNALMGGATGAGIGAGLGVAAPMAGRAVAAGARRFMGPATPRQNALLQAGTEEAVPLNMSDVFPGARNTISTLETIPGAAGPVQRGIAAGRDAIEGRVEQLGRGGTPRENMGEVFQDAGRRFVGRANNQGDRLYTRARKAAGDTLIRPRDVIKTLSELFQGEGEVPGGTKAGAVIQRYVEDFNGSRGAITLEGARKMRSELLTSLRTDGGLSKKAATRITGQIMSAVNRDIERSLTAAGKGNAVKLYRQADKFWAQSREEIERVTEKFIGTEDNPKPVEQVLAAIQSAMGPKGNSKGLGGMLRRLSPDERRDYAATIVEPLGRAGVDEPFSPALFISQIRKVSPASRRLVFGADGERSIQNLIRLSEAKKATVQSLNNSRSGMVSNYRVMLSSLFTTLPGGGAIIGMATGMNGATGALGGVAIGGAAVGVSRQIARAMMNEPFTRLLANAPTSSSPRAINAHIGKMRQLAAKDPNVRAAVQSIEEQLLRFANDNVSAVTRSAASPGGTDSEGQ